MNEEVVFRQISRQIARPGGIVCVADHASNTVPDDIPLGIDPSLLNEHIAVDIGVEGLTERLARRHDMPAHIACVSRLVCDLHRNEDDRAVVPTTSDGHLIPGNIGADLEMRLDRARHLLRQSQMPIVEIAIACGFVSASHFAKCYRELHARSPQQERAGRQGVASVA